MEVFKKKVVTTARTFVHPEQLPPTSDAAKYHSYQVQEWNGDPDSELIAEEWGWENKDDFLCPLTTDVPQVPSSAYENREVFLSTGMQLNEM